MTRLQQIHDRRDAILRLAAHYGIHCVRLFGSVTRGEAREDSDVDVLVDFPMDRTADAWRFVEDVCARHAVPLDIHDARTTKAAFVERVCTTGLVLS